MHSCLLLLIWTLLHHNTQLVLIFSNSLQGEDLPSRKAWEGNLISYLWFLEIYIFSNSVNTSWLCKAMKNLIVNKSWGWAEAVVSAVSLTLHKQQTVLLRGCHETLFIIWMKIEASVKGSPVQAKACWRRTQSLTSTHWTTNPLF